jgi:hypothetical protein
LFRYARVAEATFGKLRLCTSNLHLCMVHLPGQVLASGPSSITAEFWVERIMLLLKRATKNRTMHYPELTVVNTWLLDAVLRRLPIRKCCKEGAWDAGINRAVHPF